MRDECAAGRVFRLVNGGRFSEGYVNIAQRFKSRGSILQELLRGNRGA